MNSDLSTKRISAITVTNISRSFTYKMAAKISLHIYGTKLRRCHPIIVNVDLKRAVFYQGTWDRRTKGHIWTASLNASFFGGVI